jgi:acetylglutamate kinase
VTAAGRTRRSIPARTARATPVVVKLGGELLGDAQQVQAVGSAIAALQGGLPLVVVHGGGKDIDAALARAGIAKKQVDGLRITDEPTLDVVVSVLAGHVNTRLVAAVTAAGGDGVGLTGADGAIGLVDKAAPHVATTGAEVDLGRVGMPAGRQAPRLIAELCRGGYIPVIASIGMSRSGELYNVNADTFAAHLAGVLGAARLVIAGGTPGVLDESGRTIPTLDLDGIERLVAAGTATAGMVAKLSACRDALLRGVREVLIVNGHDLRVLTQLVRQGSRAVVSGYTQVRRKPSPSRTGRSGDTSSRSLKVAKAPASVLTFGR